MGHKNKKQAAPLYLVIGIIFVLSGCQNKEKLIKKNVHANLYVSHTCQYPKITIWIHGTRFLHCKLFKDIFKDNPQLKHASDIPNIYHLRTIANTVSNANPDQFPFSGFYIFGWSGKLNAQLREDSARILHTEISNLVERYSSQYNVPPKIQIITHSHGGNIALNLAKIRKDRSSTFTIDRLMLLACPVQTGTMNYTKHPMFKRVYSLYSSLDFVQVMAPQLHCDNISIHQFPPFSRRRFPTVSNLIQAKVKLDRHAPGHNEFICKPFLTTLAATIATLDKWHTQAEVELEKEPHTKLLRINTNSFKQHNCC